MDDTTAKGWAIFYLGSMDKQHIKNQAVYSLKKGLFFEEGARAVSQRRNLWKKKTIQKIMKAFSWKNTVFEIFKIIFKTANLQNK